MNATLTRDLFEANAKITALEAELDAAETSLASSTDDSAVLRGTVANLEVQLNDTQAQLATVCQKCDALERDGIADAKQVASLTAELSSEVAVREAQVRSVLMCALCAHWIAAHAEWSLVFGSIQDIQLKEQSDELSQFSSQSEQRAVEIESLRTEKTELSERLTTTLEQHQRASKLQQQHAAELKVHWKAASFVGTHRTKD